jgi:hypothetical protein
MFYALPVFTAECMANACCQDMSIMHAVDCLLKDKEMEDAVIQMDPMLMVYEYNKKYPKMSGSNASSVHKFIKMALGLRQNGIKLTVGSYFSFTV